MKNIAIGILLIIAAVSIWGLFSHDVVVSVNGQYYDGPLSQLAGLWSVMLTLVGIFCAAIILMFVFGGLFILVLLFMAFMAVMFIGFFTPILLPVLLPLLLVMLCCALFSRKSKSGTD